MASGPITFRIVDTFFDKPRVRNAVDKATRRQLSKAGAFVRRTSRSSIKPAKKRAKKRKAAGKYRRGADPTISRPGQPPRMHTRTGLNIRTILFGYEATRKTVVVGPVAGNGKLNNVPELLEHGGVGRLRRGRRGPIKTAKWRKRPFMLPALRKEAPKFPTLFANSIR